MFQFSIRDIVWLTLVVGLCLFSAEQFREKSQARSEARDLLIANRALQDDYDRQCDISTDLDEELREAQRRYARDLKFEQNRLEAAYLKRVKALYAAYGSPIERTPGD